MKIKTIALTVAALAFTGVASASQIDADRGQSSIDITLNGNIDRECRVDSSRGFEADIDLTSSDRQTVSSVGFWCNFSTATATVSYSSLYGGLKQQTDSGEGQVIPYDIAHGRLGATRSAEGEFASSAQVVGRGSEGNRAGQTLSLAPVVNSFEAAGVYTDQLTVTVQYN